MRRSLMVSIMFLLAQPALWAQAKALDAAELDALLVRLEKEWGAIQSLSAEFEQEKHLLLFEDVLRAKGVCAFQSPGRVRFELREPFRSVMVAQEGRVAKYEYEDGRWKKLDVPAPEALLAVTDSMAQWMAGRFRASQAHFEISAEKGDQVTLFLRPKSESFRKRVEAIELRLSPELDRIAEIVLREPEEDFTRLKFVEERRGEAFPDGYFDPGRAAPVEGGED